MRTVILTVLLAAALAAEVKPGIIGPDDTVTVTALNVEEISKAWRGGPSGDLNLPLIGRVKAAGMTAEQLQNEISTRLKEYVREPQVTVFVSDFKSRPITVSGAVEKPGTVQLERPAALFAVLAQAGGVKDAGPTVTISRNLDHGEIPYKTAHHSPDGRFSIVEAPLQEVLRGQG